MSASQLEPQRFARLMARWLLVELAITNVVDPGELDLALERCWLCRRELEAHEQPERICDRCLRAHQTWPRAA